jgi:osmotically-inducible protein OsmY
MKFMTSRAAAFALPAILAGGLSYAGPVTQEKAAQETREAAKQSGNAVKDSWITMKIHSMFVPEDALEHSDIDVDTRAGVVTLTGTVPTPAARTRAVQIAKATDGVKNVTDRLKVVPAGAEMAEAREAGREAAAETREAGRKTADAARETGRDAADTAREGGREAAEAGRQAGRSGSEAVGTAGRAVTDGWIKSKIYSQFITEDALDDAEIDIDINKGAVTLTGSVPSEAAKARAATIAKATDGVKDVQNKLQVAK